ncbi:hypothetical protein AC792_06425 [Arthrobacter sp. RIT-PI-e]|uniref:pullulanase X25 domain-containing protein n=1 Tax=Arthrobacter sp. RIT-PI-e TaxID=1681197 RepID=UPI0006769247|nr:hypothetical protein [Arthrobacter sp. RIT-PI-e]KNC19473.1 hypothetical protein AC792_06425 [Arthrobacter sp. RIT-PI-e]
MRDLTARRLRTLVHLMAEHAPDRTPCMPGTLLEEVITAVPREVGDHEEPRGGLFEEFLKATDSLEDSGLLAKGDAGWSLTASGRAAATSPSALGEALGRMEISGAVSRATDPEPHPAPPTRTSATGSEKPSRSVGLAGGFLPAGSSTGATDQQPFGAALRPAWAADDPGLRLSHDATEDLWSLTLALDPGHYEYKVILGASWKENYGVRGMRSGPNLVLDLPLPREVTFTFDHVSKLVTLV